MTLYSADFKTRPDFRASPTISGPIPAQSPRVMPTRGLLLMLILMLVIVLVID
jgi:hypothetical protein